MKGYLPKVHSLSVPVEDKGGITVGYKIHYVHLQSRYNLYDVMATFQNFK